MSLALVVVACPPSSTDKELTVFAAASLRDVAGDLEREWPIDHPGATLTIATEASNVLAAQISEGAPADVFLSADAKRPRELAADGLTAAEPVPFASNRVALVVPLEGDRVNTPRDLADPGVRIVGINAGAPISRYTLEAVAQLARTMPDAAFVYHTDALSADRVREIPLPVEVATTAEYAAVQISGGPLAAEFVSWLTGLEAIAVIEAHGFEAPSA